MKTSAERKRHEISSSIRLLFNAPTAPTVQNKALISLDFWHQTQKQSKVLFHNESEISCQLQGLLIIHNTSETKYQVPYNISTSFILSVVLGLILCLVFQPRIQAKLSLTSSIESIHLIYSTYFPYYTFRVLLSYFTIFVVRLDNQKNQWNVSNLLLTSNNKPNRLSFIYSTPLHVTTLSNDLLTPENVILAG